MTLLCFTHQLLFKFYNGLLPPTFEHFFTPVKSIHSYNTRSAANQSYYIPRARTNYGLYNIRLNGTKIWKSIGEDIKQSSLKIEKGIYKYLLIFISRRDCYML